MDIEGLGRLIEEKHAQTVIMFDSVKEALEHQRDFCSHSMSILEKRVLEHENSLTRIKTIGSLLSLLWGAIVLITSHIIDGWRK